MDFINEIQKDLRPALLELVRGGMRQADIAREVGLSRATINFAIKKTDGHWMPKYETGRRLMALLEKSRKTNPINSET